MCTRNKNYTSREKTCEYCVPQELSQNWKEYIYISHKKLQKIDCNSKFFSKEPVAQSYYKNLKSHISVEIEKTTKFLVNRNKWLHSCWNNSLVMYRTKVKRTQTLRNIAFNTPDDLT